MQDWPRAGRLPRPVEGIDVRSLPLGPEDAFVLTRVDGISSDTDIVAATGLDLERVRTSLSRLAELGAIVYDDAPSIPPQRPRQTPSGTQSNVKLDHPVVESRPGDAPTPAALYDPGDLDEQVDLDLPRRRKILDYFYRLDTADHYELLGVAGDADRKQIKSAYFETVALFHPDRYYGKSLGSFKTKLEKVFQRLTEAHDVLSRKPLRSAYDEYLRSQKQTKSLERAMSDQQIREEELEEARRLIEADARVSERHDHVTTRGSVIPPADPDARRKMLARKLRRGSGSMKPPVPSTPPPSSSRVAQEHVADELRRRYESRINESRDSHINRYRDAAEAAIEKKDLVSAANSLRIASSLAPNDETLRARLEEIQQQANTMLADTYLEQAKYEEQSKRYLEAAKSYERALRGKPTAVTYDKAAHCLLEGNGDLKKAGDYARKAVSLAPKASEPRITLAKIYVQAGMKESALVEFERAGQLAPHDASIKDWVRRIKRGEV